MTSDYLSTLDPKDRKRYSEKLKLGDDDSVTLPDPCSLNGWLDDPDKWAETDYGCIYSYLINTPGPYDGEAMKVFKSLEAYNYFISGHVVGLGNPGMEGSRHSVGMEVLDALATRLDMANRWHGDKQVSGDVILSHVENTYVVLLCSRLLMNTNGVSVAKAARKYGIKPEDIILVHDELDKPLGKISIKYGGSARGHNGVRSCIDSLQSDVMTRLRVGIGRPVGKAMIQHYVLSRFSSEEKRILKDSVLDNSVELLLKQILHKDSLSASSPAGGRHTAQEKK